jgi:tRNA nucleotidyltransferase/poly(A) polymerase
MTDIFAVHSHFEPALREFGQVVIAGGAVRDHLLGRQAKDFDVFVLWDNPDDYHFEESMRVIEPA